MHSYSRGIGGGDVVKRFIGCSVAWQRAVMPSIFSQRENEKSIPVTSTRYMWMIQHPKGIFGVLSSHLLQRQNLRMLERLERLCSKNKRHLLRVTNTATCSLIILTRL